MMMMSFLLLGFSLAGASAAAFAATTFSFRETLGKSKGQESVRLDISIAPFIENDSETIPFSSKTDAAGNSVNDQNITGFLNKWIRDPRKISNRQTGCEINFNRYFSSKSSVRASSEIWIELEQVDEELSKIEEEISRHTVWRKK